MSTQRSLQYLIDRAKATLIAKTGQNNPAIDAIASAIAGVSYGQYGYQDLLFRELHPETCSEAWLYLHATRHKEPRLQPQFATGAVSFFQTGGVVTIPKGRKLVDDASNEYKTVREQYSDEEVAVIALKAGTDSNLPNGAKLKLTEALNGINPNNVTSLGMSGGTGIEDLEHWRGRVVNAFNKNQMIGKREDYESWAISAHADVDFAWALDNTPTLGMVEVYMGARENDPTLSSEVMNLVQQAFEDNRLAGCHPLAHQPQKRPIDIEIQGIEDEHIREDIIAALEDLIKSKMGVIDEETQKPESITPTDITLVIAEITGGFILKAPLSEVSIEQNQIHTVGEITWTPPT
ncbi:baseplate J/gp47 family protein [Vibrio diabolicus]|uniref:baseplate J/gp47 family protein n=1 Tax=Vibrio diabolicus TaxID=50719 RepID=UPI00232E6492|nr:baseplate J/gp47 family protein [Vibrio diabolicus]